MATIFMSMSGEGRGHATRMCSLTEGLKQDHRIVLFAPADAYAFLAPLYVDDPQVQVVELPGLIFHYVQGKLAVLTSIYEGFRYLRETLDPLVDLLCEWIERERPSLIVTDFDPALPRAAMRMGVPFISFTHQHFLLANDLSFLPLDLKIHAWTMSFGVAAHYRGQFLTIVSSFFKADLRKGYEETIQVGPMIRPDIRNAVVTEGDYFLSYLRKKTPDSVVNEIVKTGQRVRIYGIGEREPVGNVTFHAVNPQDFARDLAGTKAILCAAGNQLLGESVFLGKPVFAMPEAAHHEQQINSQFLRRMGCGDFVTLERFRAEQFLRFVENLGEYRRVIESTYRGREGTGDVVQIIKTCLNSETLAAAPARQLVGG